MKRSLQFAKLPLLLVLVLSFGFVSAEPPQGKKLAAPLPGQKILVTGHSFHVPVMGTFDQIARTAKIEGHQLVARQMIGGSSVTQHWDKIDAENIAKQTLNAGSVDVLTMSPNWIVPDPAIDKFVELGLQKNPKLRSLIQVSWYPWDGLKPPARVADNAERDSKTVADLRPVYNGFRDALRAQVREINAKHKSTVAYIVPVGEAVLRLREKVIAGQVPGVAKQSALFGDPIGHAGPVVLTLAAYCQYACIYRRNPEELTVPSPQLDQVSPELAPLLKKIAWSAVTDEPLSGVSTGP